MSQTTSYDLTDEEVTELNPNDAIANDAGEEAIGLPDLPGKSLLSESQMNIPVHSSDHDADFIRQRLAPAHPPNDGKQTPMRNHPVFIAQHATATCCRGCLEKWHRIKQGNALREDEKQYVLAVLREWLLHQDSLSTT